MLILENTTYDILNDAFYRAHQPDAIDNPELLKFNSSLAEWLDLSIMDLDTQELAAVFSGNSLNTKTKPIAMAYAGHQFGQFVPQLGDGRALLMGDAVAKDNLRYDIQLKGSGPTAFSRNGDGKSALGPVMREYIISEAMYQLGVPTTRALAAVATNESVYRQSGPEPAGIFTRVARTHIRIGSFEYYASRQNTSELKQLADFTIQRLYPSLVEHDKPYLDLFKTVAKNLLQLVAKWQAIGFIHGVMNTDNMSLAGETIDYGPCAFMDNYQAGKVFSSIDRGGRYAFNQQPSIAQWNLSVFASCLVPLIDSDEKKAIRCLQDVMNTLPDQYECFWLEEFRPKLGLFNGLPEDKELIEQTLANFEQQGTDFTNGFRALSASQSEAHRARLSAQPQSLEESIALMNEHNPWLIPRNHQIEKAIRQGYEGDFTQFNRLINAYHSPYEELPDNVDLTSPPEPNEVVRRTFCGT